MTDIHEEVKSKLRRSLTQEFVRQEDDFDGTRNARQEIIAKMMATVRDVRILDTTGSDGVAVLYEDTSARMGLLTSTLKALADTEKAASMAIGLKLRHQEIEVASAAAHKDRLAVVLHATAPGTIVEAFPAEDMDKHLDEMFGATIKDFELKVSPRDLSE